MNFRILRKEEYDKWNDFVDNSPQGSIYSKSFYLHSVGYLFSIGVVENDSRILAGIILAKNELGVHSNPLFVKYLGILYADTTEVNSKKGRKKYKIDRLIIENLPKRVPISYLFHPKFTNWLNFFWEGYSQVTHYTYQICFSEKHDFRKLYSIKNSQNIRVAKKNQLNIVNVELNNFCNIIQKTYEARGKRPPYKKERLVNILTELEKYDCFYYKGISDSDGNIHAVAGIVYDENSANMILNGSDPLYRKYAGNTLVIDHMIEFASMNCKIFDFEGSMHQRIEHFYFGFGGVLTPYYHIWKNNIFTRIYLRLIALVKKLYK